VWASVLILAEKWGTPPWDITDPDDQTTRWEWRARAIELESARAEVREQLRLKDRFRH